MAQHIDFDLPERSESDEKPREGIDLYINAKDTGYKVYTPTLEQITMFSRVASRYCEPMDKMSGMFQFLEAVTDDESYNYITDRYNDPKDSVDFEWLTQFLLKMAELFKDNNENPEAAKKLNGKITVR